LLLAYDKILYSKQILDNTLSDILLIITHRQGHLIQYKFMS
jgi:hypothetical protein